MKSKVISKTSEWNFELLTAYDKQIAKVAKEFRLDTYPNQIEVISSDQMLDAYAAIGMPINYNHWSFGKKFLQMQKDYRRGHMGLAYEIVINSNPCIAYLMEENSLPMQALVIAHACYGHNSFFKNNYLFTTWTNADAIIDYLIFARNYITDCEEKFGMDAVEEILDACHALMTYGVDRYKHPDKLSLHKERERQKSREEYLQSQVNVIWTTIPKKTIKPEEMQERFPSEPQENLLYFFEKNAPLLEPWEREIVRIVRKVAQYFYPQRQTQVMNEGWATFWHYTILNKLFDDGFLTHEFMLEILQSHTNVIYQPGFDDPRYSGVNPYALGFNIYKDIRRICEQPTEEDRYWFPDLVNQDWIEKLDFAMRNFKDESFIAQYLSPHLIRDLKLFSIADDEKNTDLVISAIHNEDGYQRIRQTLSEQYNLGSIEPNIQVYSVDTRGDRSLLLRHVQYKGRPLDGDTKVILKHVQRLWGFNVRLESVDNNGVVQTSYRFPE